MTRFLHVFPYIPDFVCVFHFSTTQGRLQGCSKSLDLSLSFRLNEEAVTKISLCRECLIPLSRDFILSNEEAVPILDLSIRIKPLLRFLCNYSRVSGSFFYHSKFICPFQV